MDHLKELETALLSVTAEVYHFYAKSPKAPYIIWSEDGQGDAVRANGLLRNQAITGTVDLFTDNPEDKTLFERIQTALDGVCAWALTYIQYEEDTKLVHYEWTWEVPDC